MFYITESVYVGPNKDTRDLINSDFIAIGTEPNRKFGSNEVCINGFCGSMNDTSINACGEYKTIKEARAAIKAKFGDVRKKDLQGNSFSYDDDDYFEVFKKGLYHRVCKSDVADCVYEDANMDIYDDTSDKEIKKFAAQYESSANSEGCTYGDGLEDILKEYRENKRI